MRVLLLLLTLWPAAAASAQEEWAIEAEEEAAAAAAPEDVVRQAVDAQVRGDVAALLALAPERGFDPAARHAAEGVLGALARRAKLSDPRVEIRAVAVSPGEKVAVVRFRHACRVTVGETSSLREGGSLALLLKQDGAWRLHSMVADELLTLEPPADKAEDLEQAAPPLVDIRKVNRVIDQTLRQTRLDEGKIFRDEFYSAWGAVPIVGDVVSSGYTTYERLKTLFVELPGEVKAGNAQAALLDMGLLGWGVVQVVTEPIPGLDSAADQVEVVLEQWKYNETQWHNFRLLRTKMLTRSFREDKKYLFIRFPPGEEPEGLTFGAYEEWKGRLPALARLTFVTPALHARAHPLGFEVGLQWTIAKSESEDLFLAAKSLGARVARASVDEVAHLPVRLSVDVKGDASRGAPVFSRFRVEAGHPLFDLTCTRGQQELQLEMADGSTTEVVKVDNRVLNVLDGVLVRGEEGERDEVSLGVGDTLGALRLVGHVKPDGARPEIAAPDLTGVGCAQPTVMGTDLVSLAPQGRWPEASFALTGKAIGTAALEVSLPAEAPARPLKAGVPVTVTGTAAAGVWVQEGKEVEPRPGRPIGAIVSAELRPGGDTAVDFDTVTAETGGDAAWRSKHAWSAPPGTLRPGDTLRLPAQVGFDVSRVEATQFSQGCSTELRAYFPDARTVVAKRLAMVTLHNQASGKDSQALEWVVTSGPREGEAATRLQIVAEAAHMYVSAYSVTWTYRWQGKKGADPEEELEVEPEEPEEPGQGDEPEPEELEPDGR